MTAATGTGTRTDRRKARTRGALIRAAQAFIADDHVNAPITEITEAADVAIGSFYNHFESREQLFEEALTEALESFGHALDGLTTEVEDPAHAFAQSFRLAARLGVAQPQMARLLVNAGPALIDADRGLAPRAKRDIATAVAAGRFTVADPGLAYLVVAGALLSLLVHVLDAAGREPTADVDQVCEDLLRMLGLAADEAAALAHATLPELVGLDHLPGD